MALGLASEGVRNELAGMVREIGAVPVAIPGRGVVRDGAVCPVIQLEIGTAPRNGGLPRLTAANVGVSGPFSLC